MPFPNMNFFRNKKTLPQPNPWLPPQTPQQNPFAMRGQGNFPAPTGFRNAGAQGYTSPGYPPQGSQGFGQQPLMKPMSNSQVYPGFVTSGYSQMPVQPAWEGPKKGGIKEFFSNLMSKGKR